MKTSIITKQGCAMRTLAGICLAAASIVPSWGQSPTADGFNPDANAAVHAIAVQPDGKVLVGGWFTSIAGQQRQRIARLNPDGTLDETFNASANEVVSFLVLQEDGKILAGGLFTQLAGQPRSGFGRLNPDGTLDTGFNPVLDAQVSTVVLQPDGKVLIGGNSLTLPQPVLVRLNPDGTVDADFNAALDGMGVSALVVQPNGKILVGGNFGILAGYPRMFIGRLNANGSIDPGFRAGDPTDPGGAMLMSDVMSLVLQPDGKILAITMMGAVRLNSDGTLDPSFTDPAPDGMIESFVVQTDGKVIIAGGFSTLAGGLQTNIARLNSDGALETAFNPCVSSYPSALALQPDGMTLVGGVFTTISDLPRNRIGRLNNTAPATQSLTYSGSTITWLRGGTGPEVSWTKFDYSTNAGANWNILGAGSPANGRWELSGTSLPAGSTIRAHGFAAGGNWNHSSWFVETIGGAPCVLTSPTSQTNNAGTSVMFSARGGGSEPISYRWLKDNVPLADGGNIAGSATLSLSIGNLLRVDAGGYSVVLSNADGCITSAVAILTVIDPVITGQPASQTRIPGQMATFEVTAAGTGLNFQWRKDGTPLAGCTGPALTLANLEYSDTGSYSVVVSNQYGSLTSAAAVLTMNLPTLDTWFDRNAPEPVLGDHGRITFGNGTFAVVGSSIWISSNGLAWTRQDSGTTAFLNSAVWGDGKFVAVGAAGAVLTSPDGGSWAGQPPATGTNLSDVAYGNGTYVAVGGGGTIVTSTNGTDWVSANSGTAMELCGVAFGNGTFAAVGSTGSGRIILTSEDAVTWTTRLLVPRLSRTEYALKDITFGNGQFVAIGTTISYEVAWYGQIFISGDNGVNWTNVDNSSSVGISGVAWGNGAFVVVGDNSLRSTNGVNWTPRAGGGFDVAYGNGLFVAVGTSNVLTSVDGTSWSCLGRVAVERLCGVTWGAGKVVAVGFAGTVLTSSDGTAWTSQDSGTSLGLYSVAYGNGTFVAAGQVIISSTNGIDWTSRDSGPNGDFEAVAYVNGAFMAVGAGGAIKVSLDGIAWSSRDPGATSTLYGVAYGAGLYVVVGAGGVIRSSADGITWTNRTSGTSYDLNGVTYGGGQFLAQGNNGVRLTSSNGVNWTVRNTGSWIGTACTTSAYGFGRYVTLCADGTILVSANAISWETKNSGSSEILLGVCATPDRFVIVGDNGVILQSGKCAPEILANEGNFGFHNNKFGFKVAALAGQTLAVQVSTNLLNWTPLGTVTLGSVPLYFSDSGATNFSVRFYRTRLQ
jgi:uncharacterized delta-60 repeat protein